jgi:phage gpG-like protein
MIKATITSQNERLVVASLEALDAKLLQAAETGLARGLLALVSIVQTEWIQDGARRKGELGPGARLHSISGRLRQGMQSRVRRSANAVIGEIGNNVKYAAFHEFGFHGVQNVRAHARVVEQYSGALDLETDTRRAIRSNTGEFLGYKESRKASAKFQKSGIVMVQYVKAHQRRVRYPGRPFVRPALNANLEMITGEIRKEMNAVEQ